MRLKGVYTVKQNGDVIAKSKNQITANGLEMIRDWFATPKQQNIKLLDINSNNTSVSDLNNQQQNIVTLIPSDGLKSQSMESIMDLFSGYKEDKYYYTTSKNAYIRMMFNKLDENNQLILTTRKIAAIGIDIITTPRDNQTDETIRNLNSNIQFRYSNSVENQNLQLNDRSDIAIPVQFKQKGFTKRDVGYEQKIYYLDKPTQMSQIKIAFNTFNNINDSGYIRYIIYAINLYQHQQVITPPTHMSLYNTEGERVFHQQIQLSYSNDGYSTVFKTTVGYDQLDSTTQIGSVSTDYHKYNETTKTYDIVPFSYSEYPVPWSQQQLTNIQLQYELFFSNEQQDATISSDNSSNDSSYTE